MPDKSLYLGAGNLKGYPPGIQLACFAETVLLTMAGVTEDVCIGKEIDMHQVDMVEALADEHGFNLFEPLTGRLEAPVPGSPQKAMEAAARCNR